MILALILGVALVAPVPDTARFAGDTLVIEPIGIRVQLPPGWLGAAHAEQRALTCGHHVHGPVERRLITSRAGLDSLHDITGEWDREYAAVTDSIFPSGTLVAQVGPEPLGGGSCFADLQVRMYVTPDSLRLRSRVRGAGLRAAQAFFASAALASRDTADWHVDRLRWQARYEDYGGEANVALYSLPVRGRIFVVAFLYASLTDGPAQQDRDFILQHVRRH